MREIKFRGKRNYNGEWVYGFYVRYSESSGYMFGDYVDKGEVFDIDPETVGQLTGLHDKNGKEIYEGDILQNNAGGYAPVIYRCGGFFVELVDCEEFGTMYVPLNEAILLANLVGNIHENPELIND